MNASLADRDPGVAGDIYAALTAVAYGSAFVATAIALDSFTPIGAAGWRGAIAAAGIGSIGVLGRLRSAPGPRLAIPGRRVRLIVLALLGGPVFYACMNQAVAHVGPTISAFVAGLYAILAAVLAPIVLGERLRRRTVIALLIALLGTALLADLTMSADRLEGLAWGLSGAISFALFLLVARRWSVPFKLDPLTVSFATATATAVVLGGTVLVSTPGALFPNGIRPASAAAIGWLGVVTAGGQFLAVLAVRLIPAERSSAFLLLNPLSATLLAIVLLGTVPTPAEVFGGALVVLGMALASGLATSAWRRARRPSVAIAQ
jgi:drug/metabolite transporter (DMT)-like permease